MTQNNFQIYFQNNKIGCAHAITESDIITIYNNNNNNNNNNFKQLQADFYKNERCVVMPMKQEASREKCHSYFQCCQKG